MKEIFLSASIPVVGRGDFHKTADPYLIQCAIIELVVSTIENYRIVWGGHPAITPMIKSICEDLNVDYQQSVTLYQSNYFQDSFPEENRQFQNIVYTDAVANDKKNSLEKMRIEMLSRPNLCAAVFIGGMDGIFDEYNIFKKQHPNELILPVPATGGAALELAKQLGVQKPIELDNIDFSGLFHYKLLKHIENHESPLPNIIIDELYHNNEN